MPVHADVITVLRECGMTQVQADAFASQHSFQNLNDVMFFRPEMAKEMIKTYNIGRRLNQKMGAMHEIKLEAFIYWARELESRQQPVVAADWTAAQVATSISETQAVKDRSANGDVLPEVGMIEVDTEFYEWSDKFLNLLDSIKSGGIGSSSILYIVRPDKPAGWDPVADATSDKERIMYQVMLTGSVFDTDNKRVWDELKKRTITSNAFEWIKTFEATSNGRGAWRALMTILEGQEAQNKRLQMAVRITSVGDGGLTYNNEYMMSFVAYASKLLKYYNVIERLRNDVATETKVQRLLDGIKISNNTDVRFAVNHASDNFMNDWNAAVSYVSSKMSKVFPEKDKKKFHSARRASEMASGRGRGGRGRGRNGRGRDGGRGNGGRKGLYHHPNGKSFYNGVDVTDCTRSFSASEKMKLDRDAWNYIRNRMPGGRFYEGPDPRGRGRGRGRGGRGGRGNGGRGGDNDDRSVNAAGRNGDANYEQPEEQQAAAGDPGAGRGAGRGGRMGSRMGRGLYGK